MEKFQTKRSWGTIAPDKTFDIGHVDVRFDVPLGMSWEAMQIRAYPHIQTAISQFEKLGHWQFYDKIPVQYHASFIHSASLAQANMLLSDPKKIFQTNKSGAQAVGDILGTDVVTMVARVYFIRPLTPVNVDEEKEFKEQYVTYENGYVPVKDMPEDYLALKEEAQNDVSTVH